MIVSDFLRALGQIGDPRFRSVLLRGIGLTVALLVAVYAAVFWVVGWLIPDDLTLFGWSFGWVDDFTSVASVLLMMGLSVFLMVPVASAFTSIFLDEVADAVEEVHYPRLPPAPRVAFSDQIRDGAAFLGVLILANIAAFAAYIALPPFAPVIFLLLNGFLLGREYFQLVAMRRLGRKGARAAQGRHLAKIWAAGTLMALPLVVPVLNLLVPVLGAATFTHLFHRLERD